jgi:hypothetical protein
MHYLIWSGRIATPMAMVSILFYEITHSVSVGGWWVYIIMAGALGSAIGIEIVGILSGVTLERFWRIDDRPRAVLALFLLITYTIVAMYILRHNTILWPIPIIAAVVYLVSALAESAGEIIEQQVTSQADDAAWQRRQEEREAEFERQLKLQQQRDRTAVKLAKLEGEKRQDKRRVERQETGNLPSDWRQLSQRQKHDLAHAAREERENMFPELAGRTRREWHSRLDKLAAQNGHT